MAEPTPIGGEIPDLEARIARRAAEAKEAPPILPPLVDDDEGRRLDRQSRTVPRTIPARFKQARVDQLDGALADLAARWIAADMQPNVVLVGAVGVGKTHTAAALAIAAHQAGRHVRFVPVVELLDQLRPGGDPDAMDTAIRTDVLVLDDLGAERPTDWTGERLYAVINRRWLEQRPTIATSNLDAAALEAAVGPKAWSRLWHEAIRLKVAGNDRRRAS